MISGVGDCEAGSSVVVANVVDCTAGGTTGGSTFLPKLNVKFDSFCKVATNSVGISVSLPLNVIESKFFVTSIHVASSSQEALFAKIKCGFSSYSSSTSKYSLTSWVRKEILLITK